MSEQPLNETAASTNLDQTLKNDTTCEESPAKKETPEQIREKCKERMDAFRRDVKKEMPLSD